MRDDRQTVVQEVFCQVLEQFAFMFGDPAEGPEVAPPDEPLMQATMRFSGAASGRLTLVLAERLGRELAANALGLDPDDEMAVKGAADSVKELLNVTCGNLLTALAGDEPVFELAPPEVERVEADVMRALLEAPDAVVVLIDDMDPAVLRVVVEETTAECVL